MANLWRYHATVETQVDRPDDCLSRTWGTGKLDFCWNRRPPVL